MIRVVRHWLCAIVMFGGCPFVTNAAQESNELLLPVSDQEVAKLMEKSNYRLRGQLYPAKRYRFVRINYTLLEQSDSEFSITPFDDLALRVSTIGIEPANSSGRFVQWRGEMIDSRFPGRAIVLNVRSEYQAPPSVARKLAAEQRAPAESSSSFSAQQPSNTDGHATVEIDLKTVGGEWPIITENARVVLTPVEDDPRYHLVYEEDRSKVPNSSHGNPETAEKLRLQQEFMRSLESERAADQLEPNK